MDIDIPLTPIDAPVFQLDNQVFVHIARASVAAAGFDKATSEDAKLLLNQLFTNAIAYLHEILEDCDPASWILEAYKQVQMWTFVYRGDMSPSIPKGNAPKEMAPVGRYGWRYIIDYLLPKTAGRSVLRPRPDARTVSRAFTALTVAAYSSEISNLIHHFPDVYDDIQIDISDATNGIFPKFSDKTMAEQKIRQSYLMKTNWETWKKYPELAAGFSNKRIRSLLNKGLVEGAGFSIDELDRVVHTLQSEVLASGYIIVHTFNYVADWVADVSGVSKSRTEKILNFMLLSASDRVNARSFLNKNDSLRMLSFAGVKLPQLSNPLAIYPSASARKSHIRSAKNHVIMSLFTVAEWMDIFQYQCANGQRPDLKSNEKLNKALEAIEQYQRRTIFENGVAQILADNGFSHIIGLKKWPDANGKSAQLPCGEIDILAYSKQKDLLLIVECKANAPATDARGYSQQFRDHFKQKDYDGKFQKKIRWIRNGGADLSYLTRLNENFDLGGETRIIPIFVTKYPSVAHFYCKEYRVLTVDELNMEISQF